ncbi:Serine carboxypeptidase, putative [Perkinsus marinus ATCC 50983]|uniref:Serine carboxypeptidase, putative n=1 Tax=Perkinsus marinus (strain ATCC 50983 / TXsc) TaxID=423536 RepID=C5KLU7_PERM5|nr:Serine carboxypeptidase, putative [Perkinsus marinus ATCC 50983]EER14546.1 Serine carboxypeptidase, putative [Perkinsus marinus ATCC 50983]|eukprot:XP_002782751.1 Serine carboxypeptidase, putative [Perkinsus marinus ATCC 50983]
MPILVASFVVMLGTQIIKNQELKANFRGVMALSGEIGPSAVYQGCVDMASQRSLVPQDILNKMQSDMKLCQAALADCNSNGPGKPAEKDKCLKAATLCDTGTTFQLEKIHRSICDVRTKAGREYKFYKFNPGDAEKLLNSKSVQEELGVAKIFRRMNYEVFEAFIPYSAYDTTYFVNELLDQGIKVLILNGAEDFVTNYGGTEKWVFSLKGEINYGLKLASSPLRTLQVINSGHYMVLNAPGGMQRAFNSFLSGELWEG